MQDSTKNVPTETITSEEIISVVAVLDETAFKLKDAPYWLGIRQKFANLLESGGAEVVNTP